MLTEIASGITAARHGIAILKGVKSVTDHAKIEVVISELRECLAQTQESLLSAQQSIHSLNEEKAELKKQLLEVGEWNEKKVKYKLTEVRDGLFLYAYTVTGEDTPPHWACPKCFAKKQVSVLQKLHSRSSEMTCPECEFSVSPKELPPVVAKGGLRSRGQYI